MRSTATNAPRKSYKSSPRMAPPKAIEAMSTRGEGKARAAASARSSAAAKAKPVPSSATRGGSLNGKGVSGASARSAAAARSRVTAGQKKTVQTGIMNKNRATSGAMSYVGNQPAKPTRSSPLSRQNAMSKNRATRGAMGR